MLVITLYSSAPDRSETLDSRTRHGQSAERHRTSKFEVFVEVSNGGVVVINKMAEISPCFSRLCVIPYAWLYGPTRRLWLMAFGIRAISQGFPAPLIGSLLSRSFLSAPP